MTSLDHSHVREILKKVENDYVKLNIQKVRAEARVLFEVALGSRKGLILEKISGLSKRRIPYLAYRLTFTEDDENYRNLLERVEQLPPLLKAVAELPERKPAIIYFRPKWSLLPPLETREPYFCRGQRFPRIPRWWRETVRDWAGQQIVLPGNGFDYRRIEAEFVLALATSHLINCSNNTCFEPLTQYIERTASRVPKRPRVNLSIEEKEDLVSEVVVKLLEHYASPEGRSSLENYIIACTKDFLRRHEFHPHDSRERNPEDQHSQGDGRDEIASSLLVEDDSHSRFKEEYEGVLRKGAKKILEPASHMDTLRAKEELTGFEATSLYAGILTKQTLFTNKNRLGRYDEGKGRWMFRSCQIDRYLVTARLSRERKDKLNEILPVNMESVIQLAQKRRKGRDGSLLGRKSAIQLVRRKTKTGWSLKEIALWLETGIPPTI